MAAGAVDFTVAVAEASTAAAAVPVPMDGEADIAVADIPTAAVAIVEALRIPSAMAATVFMEIAGLMAITRPAIPHTEGVTLEISAA
jgi:hypothetical protein